MELEELVRVPVMKHARVTKAVLQPAYKLRANCSLALKAPIFLSRPTKTDLQL